ncbi:hypothetical protein ABIG06_003153 [Bradyrhizobium sp. USDA 326]|uniref:TniQ family protein n=1 Tax=Bradyrhizobium sp. USDA 326 TaxID=3377726 RepID=UPI003C73EDC6
MAFGTTGVPRWRRPEAEEPAHGLLLHLVELNGYSSVKTVAECLGVRMSDLRSGKRKAMATFAKAIRCPQDILEADSPVELPQNARAERTFGNAQARNTVAMSLRGIHIGADQFDRTKRKLCPACLEEGRHHRFWWDFIAVTTCPRHKLSLIDRCGCGSDTQLTWRDSELFYCGECSRNVPVERKPADPDVSAADAALLKRFGITEAPPCPVLDAMSFYDAIDTMERVGAAALGGLKPKWQSAGTLGLDPATVRARGFSILSTGGLAAVLDGLVAEFRKTNPDTEPALTTAYGWLYHWLNLKGGRAFSEILFEAFVTHAHENFHLNGRIALDASVLPGTYTLAKAAKECGIGRETMRKLGVKLAMIRPSGIEGHVLAFDGPAVRSLAEDLRSSVDFEGALSILGIDRVVLHSLISAGLISPMFGGREWRQQYAFRRSDLDAFIGRILGEAPLVDAPPESLMTAVDARQSFNLSGAMFFRLIAQNHVKVAARLREATGVAGAMVQREELRTTLVRTARREDVPVPVAALALATTNPVVRKLIEKRFLYTSKTNGQAMVTAKSFARFRQKFIGIQEVATTLGCDVERVEARAAKLGIRVKPSASRCGFHGFSREQVDAKLPQLRALVGSDLRFSAPAERRQDAA